LADSIRLMISPIKSVHFVGICGTAMASAAAAMRERGFQVTGSDQNVYPPMSDFLASRQIDVSSGYHEKNLDRRPDLVVIGNAISRGNPEAEAALERKLRYCSLPELLKEYFIRGKRSVVVSGTHGKTTTTSLLAWVFESSGRNPSFLIGGIPENFGQGARFAESDWFIIEGDEYDTAFFDKRSKFVHYLPEVVIMNNLEFDHADIFENLRAVQTTFQRLAALAPRNGMVLWNGDEPNLGSMKWHSPQRSFGLASDNSFRAVDCAYGADFSMFGLCDASRPETVRFKIGLAGELNVRNALAVACCARHCGLSDAEIQSGFDTFRGIKRRMETRGVNRGVTVVDDFGHHPTAIAETLKALRLRFPGGRLWAVFEPRSNTTRRSVFQDELAAALGGADRVVVSQVARLDQIPPNERLNPEKLIATLVASGRPAAYLSDVDSIVRHVSAEAKAGDVVCVFSNGGFGGIHQKLLAAELHF
jgi:UDP-N-acetylmuramate: L-alanyl-gamma-D-glutamyl-meso-diaminopimelate ligase